MTAARRAELTAEMAKLDTMISKLETSILNSDDVESYTFDSGAGRQSTQYRDIGKIEQTLRRLRAQRDRIRRTLEGKANPSLNLRRRRGQYHGGRHGYC